MMLMGIAVSIQSVSQILSKEAVLSNQKAFSLSKLLFISAFGWLNLYVFTVGVAVRSTNALGTFARGVTYKLQPRVFFMITWCHC